MKTKLLLAGLLIPTFMFARKVQLSVAGNWVEIQAQQTQSELKPGWTIADIKLKDKLTRYLNGSQSTQTTDDGSPSLLIEPGDREVLVDYAIIRLSRKKFYRKLPKAVLSENAYIRFSPEHFHIHPEGDMGFVCIPRMPLPKGQYIIVHLSQHPIGELQDYLVFPFQVL